MMDFKEMMGRCERLVDVVRELSNENSKDGFMMLLITAACLAQGANSSRETFDEATDLAWRLVRTVSPMTKM